MLSRCSQRKASSHKYTTKRNRNFHLCMIYTTKHKITLSKGTPPEVLKLGHLKLLTRNQLASTTKCLPTHALGSHMVLQRLRLRGVDPTLPLFTLQKFRRIGLALLGSVCTLNFRGTVSTNREVQENREDSRAVTSLGCSSNVSPGPRWYHSCQPKPCS